MAQPHDIIAMASAGGVQAQLELAAGLPPDLPAAVFVVEDARAPDVPRSAIQHVAVDHIAPVKMLASLLSRLATVRLPSAETSLGLLEGGEPEVSVNVPCPLCPALTASEHREFQQFRCHVGHTFSLESLALEQAEEVERARWAAARALEESASILHRAGTRAGSDDLRRRLAEREAAQLRDARVVREVLLHGTVLSPVDDTTAAGGV